jgi:hypothetical protein
VPSGAAPITSSLHHWYLISRALVHPDRRQATVPMLATKAAALRNVYRCAHCRSDEMAGLTMIGRVPVLRLVLELQQCRLPASRRARSELMLISAPCHFPPPALRDRSIMVA